MKTNFSEEEEKNHQTISTQCSTQCWEIRKQKTNFISKELAQKIRNFQGKRKDKKVHKRRQQGAKGFLFFVKGARAKNDVRPSKGEQIKPHKTDLHSVKKGKNKNQQKNDFTFLEENTFSEFPCEEVNQNATRTLFQ